MLPTRMNKVEFGNAVRAERERQGLTQMQLGEKMGGVDKGSIGAIERGESMAKVETAAKIKEALFGTSVEHGELSDAGLLLSKATTEEILNELKARGFNSVSLSYS